MKAVELFAGAGGLGIGVSNAGFKAISVIECDSYCCDTIRENQGRGLKPLDTWPLVQCRVEDFNFKSLANQVDLVSGGPPCQPFSIGGKHGGYNDVRDLFPEAVRAVRELRPRAFLFENVRGLTRTAFMSYFEYIRLQLTYPEITKRPRERWFDHLARLERFHTHGRPTGLFYNLVTRVLNGANYGVPQRRERVFFVGIRSDLGIEWSFPEPTHSQDALIWEQLQTYDYWERHEILKKSRIVSERTRSRFKKLVNKPVFLPWRTVRDAISDLPDPAKKTSAASLYLNHRFQPGARTYQGHTGSSLDEPAKTLKAGVHGVPGGENMLLLPNGSVRYFTVRESARLQTFSDNFCVSWFLV